MKSPLLHGMTFNIYANMKSYILLLCNCIISNVISAFRIEVKQILNVMVLGSGLG